MFENYEVTDLNCIKENYERNWKKEKIKIFSTILQKDSVFWFDFDFFINL